jgi:hypothetical protein
MSVADVKRIKKLAQRLNVRDSDVIRFAIRAMLARLMPFYEPETRGRHLVPVLVEAGVEFLRFFDLDAARLDSIINDGEEDPEKRVAREDLALIALAGLQGPYAALKLSELSEGDERAVPTADVSSSIRHYLYQKYVYRAGGEAEVPYQKYAYGTGSDTSSAVSLRLAVAGANHE